MLRSRPGGERHPADGVACEPNLRVSSAAAPNTQVYGSLQTVSLVKPNLLWWVQYPLALFDRWRSMASDIGNSHHPKIHMKSQIVDDGWRRRGGRDDDG